MPNKTASIYPSLFLVVFKILTVFFYFTLIYSSEPELFQGLAKYNIGDSHGYIDPYINFCLVKFDCTLIQPLPKHYTCSTPKWLPFGCYFNDSIDL